jgi:IS30 family transposase
MNQGKYVFSLIVISNLSAVKYQQVRQVEQFLNDRPVRKFNYKTPKQVLQGKIALIT